MFNGRKAYWPVGGNRGAGESAPYTTQGIYVIKELANGLCKISVGSGTVDFGHRSELFMSVTTHAFEQLPLTQTER